MHHPRHKIDDQHRERVFDIRKHLQAAAIATTIEDAASNASEALYRLSLIGAVRLEEPDLGNVLSEIDGAASHIADLAPAHYVADIRRGFEAAYGVVLWWGASLESGREALAEQIVDDLAGARILRNTLHNVVLCAEITARAHARRASKIVNFSAERERRGLTP